ncbi:hypothetical protein COCOBI_19-2300 [Coccomyxa sp. Obi]|nr:hypothetical protein COCOBI_19-2300 [Coccomyxa sp. Obi]
MHRRLVSLERKASAQTGAAAAAQTRTASHAAAQHAEPAAEQPMVTDPEPAADTEGAAPALDPWDPNVPDSFDQPAEQAEADPEEQSEADLAEPMQTGYHYEDEDPEEGEAPAEAQAPSPLLRVGFTPEQIETLNKVYGGMPPAAAAEPPAKRAKTEPSFTFFARGSLAAFTAYTRKYQLLKMKLGTFDSRSTEQHVQQYIKGLPDTVKSTVVSYRATVAEAGLLLTPRHGSHASATGCTTERCMCQRMPNPTASSTLPTLTLRTPACIPVISGGSWLTTACATSAGNRAMTSQTLALRLGSRAKATSLVPVGPPNVVAAAAAAVTAPPAVDADASVAAGDLASTAPAPHHTSAASSPSRLRSEPTMHRTWTRLCLQREARMRTWGQKKRERSNSLNSLLLCLLHMNSRSKLLLLESVLAKPTVAIITLIQLS